MHTYTKSSLTILFVMSLTLLTSACTQPTEDPKTIADNYWTLLQAGNTTDAEKLVSTNSQHAISEHHKRMTTVSKLNNNAALTIVSTTITSINPATNYSHTETFNTVLVLEKGQWKIDANQSHIPPAPSADEEELQQLAEELSESMQKNIDSIDNAMTQGMKLLNDALRDGSREMGDSLLQLMNELNESMQESVDKMKQRREQPLQDKPKNQPDPEKGEGII